MHALPYLLPNLTQNNVISRGTVHWQQWNPLHSINFVISDLLSFLTLCNFWPYIIFDLMSISTFCHFLPFVTFDVFWFELLSFDILSFDILSFDVLYGYHFGTGESRPTSPRCMPFQLPSSVDSTMKVYAAIGSQDAIWNLNILNHSRMPLMEPEAVARIPR